jgi:hypothetical protein
MQTQGGAPEAPTASPVSQPWRAGIEAALAERDAAEALEDQRLNIAHERRARGLSAQQPA